MIRFTRLIGNFNAQDMSGQQLSLGVKRIIDKKSIVLQVYHDKFRHVFQKNKVLNENKTCFQKVELANFYQKKRIHIRNIN